VLQSNRIFDAILLALGKWKETKKSQQANCEFDKKTFADSSLIPNYYRIQLSALYRSLMSVAKTLKETIYVLPNFVPADQSVSDFNKLNKDNCLGDQTVLSLINRMAEEYMILSDNDAEIIDFVTSNLYMLDDEDDDNNADEPLPEELETDIEELGDEFNERYDTDYDADEISQILHNSIDPVLAKKIDEAPTYTMEELEDGCIPIHPDQNDTSIPMEDFPELTFD
jgi:hypothetical protein